MSISIKQQELYARATVINCQEQTMYMYRCWNIYGKRAPLFHHTKLLLLTSPCTLLSGMISGPLGISTLL